MKLSEFMDSLEQLHPQVDQLHVEKRQESTIPRHERTRNEELFQSTALAIDPLDK